MCARFIGHALGQGDSLMRGQGDMGGGGAESALPLGIPKPDPLADPARINACANSGDFARAVTMGGDLRKRRFGDAGAGARARLYV